MKLQPQIFVTTATEDVQHKRMPDTAMLKPLPTFQHCASLKIVEIAVECANRIKLFKEEEIGIKDFMAILDCNTERKFVSNINRKVAYFFDTLSAKEVICEDWQNVIEKQGFILAPSNNGKQLKGGDLATALNDIQNADHKPEYYYLINVMGDRIKEVLDKVS